MAKWEYAELGIKLTIVTKGGNQVFALKQVEENDSLNTPIPTGFIWQGDNKVHAHAEKILALEAKQADQLKWKTLALLGTLGWESYSVFENIYHLRRPIK